MPGVKQPRDTHAFDIGLTHEGRPYSVGLDQRNRHEAIFGVSGMGKSRFLEHHIRSDIRKKYGVCLIDPDGSHPKSVFNNTLRWIHKQGYFHEDPRQRRRVVRIIDINSPDFVTNINPFFIDADDPLAPEPRILQRPLFDVFQRVWGQDFATTPTIQNLLPSIFVAMIERGLTLNDIDPIFTNDDRGKAWRHRLMEGTFDAGVRSDLAKIQATSGANYNSEVIGPVNRVTRFTRNPRVALMTCNEGRPLDLKQVMDNREILLVNLQPNDSHADTDTAHIVGTYLVREFIRASTHRTNWQQQFFLYVDEATQFLSGDVSYLLDRCRKRGLSLIMAIQRFEQLRTASDDIASAVLSTPRIMSCFGGLIDEEAKELVGRMVRLDFETGVERTKRRMPTGEFITIELGNRSASNATGVTTTEQSSDTVSAMRAATTGRSGARAETGAESVNRGQSVAPLPGPDGQLLTTILEGVVTNAGFTNMEGWMSASTEAAGHARTTGSGRAESQQQSATTGLTETLKPVYEEMYTAVQSPEALRSAAAQEFTYLLPRHFFMSVDGQSAVRLSVPDVVDVELPDKELEAFKTALYLADPAAIPMKMAQRSLQRRANVIDEKLSYIPMPGDPTRGRVISEWDDVAPEPFIVDASSPEAEPAAPTAGENIVPFPGSPPRKTPSPLAGSIHERRVAVDETGITFESLFGPWLAGAAVVEIIDPYIFSRRQFKHVRELFPTIRKHAAPNADVKLLVKRHPKDPAGQQARLNELEKLAEADGLNFFWSLDDTIHDRFIDTDTGWSMSLGRGLDIYYPPDSKKPQHRRRCLNFTVRYLKRS